MVGDGPVRRRMNIIDMLITGNRYPYNNTTLNWNSAMAAGAVLRQANANLSRGVQCLNKNRFLKQKQITHTTSTL